MATEKSIPCIVCEQPLLVKPDGSLAEPRYFAGVSIGYEAGREGDRSCEDISQLLRHAQTINEGIWGNLADRAITARVNALHVDGVAMQEEEHYTDAARSLCHLLRDVLEETERRFTQLDHWILDQWMKDQACGSGA